MQFTIDSDEGLPIRGHFDLPRQNPRAIVVIVHGFKGYKDWGFFPWLAQHLCRHDLVVCRFNMSRCGITSNSDLFDRLDLLAGDSYSIQLADLRAVIAHTRHEFTQRPIFLLGHSRGGGVALLGAPGVRHLRGVITWSSIARADRWDEETKRLWRQTGSLDIMNQRTKQIMRMSTAALDDLERNGFDIPAATKKLRVPLLAVHGGRDETVPAEESRLLASIARDGSLLVIERASHTYNAIHPLVHVPPELVYAAEASARFIGAHA